MKIPNLSWKTILRSSCLCLGLLWIPWCPVRRKPEAFEQEGQASAWRHALPTPHSVLIFLFCTSKDEHTLSPANNPDYLTPTQAHLFSLLVKIRISARPNKRLTAKSATKTHRAFVRPLGFHFRANYVSTLASSGAWWLSWRESRCSSALLDRNLQVSSVTQDVDTGVSSLCRNKEAEMKLFLCCVVVVIVPVCKYTNNV